MKDNLIIFSIVLLTVIISTANELYQHFKYNDFEWRNIVGHALFALSVSTLIIYGIIAHIK